MSDYKTISILITALGGEGGGTLMNWIIECARSQKLFVQGTSVPGVAQRTGSTSYYIEICDRNFDNEKEPILSLYPKPGRVDIVIASELLEAAASRSSLAITISTLPGFGYKDKIGSFSLSKFLSQISI